jgi:hypothetical protein
MQRALRAFGRIDAYASGDGHANGRIAKGG